MAVQYIHSKKVLHRDLKAENVFMTKKNVVKIGEKLLNPTHFLQIKLSGFMSSVQA